MQQRTDTPNHWPVIPLRMSQDQGLGVVQAFERNETQIAVSPTYIDGSTEKERQIDAVASLSDPTGYLKCNLVIECKRFIAKAHQGLTDIRAWTWFRGIETRWHTVVEAFASAQTDRPYKTVNAALSATMCEVDPRICGATR